MSDPYDPFDQWLSSQEVEPLAPAPGTFERVARSARRVRLARSAGVGLVVLVLAVGGTGLVRLVRPPGDQDIAAPSGGVTGPSSATTTSAPSPRTGADTQARSPSTGATDSNSADSNSAGPNSAGPNEATGSSGPGAGVSRCVAGQLRAGIESADGTAGHQGFTLVFVNESAQACTMYGYPGVSFVVGASGPQVNDPAVRAAGVAAVVVTLAPSRSARASLWLVQVGNYDEATCKPVEVAGFRVYPPDDTSALFVASTQRVCSAKGVGVPEVLPVQPG